MSSKHTPGPWKWSGEYTHPCGKPAWTLLGRHGLYGILTCDQGSAPQDLNDEANARLMAAAPDYHEAVQAIFDACEGNAAPVNLMAALRELDQQGKRISLDADLLIALFEAHAKATGGAQ